MDPEQRLKIYHRAVAAAVSAERFAATRLLPRYDLQDQLRRASASIALNIAEGAAEFRPIEKAKFYRIARRSAAECEAVLDLADGIWGRTSDSSALREELAAITGTLTVLILRKAAEGAARTRR